MAKKIRLFVNGNVSFPADPLDLTTSEYFHLLSYIGDANEKIKNALMLNKKTKLKPNGKRKKTKG